MPTGRTTLLVCLLGLAVSGSLLSAGQVGPAGGHDGDTRSAYLAGTQERANGTTVGTSSGPISVLAPAVLVVVLAILAWVVSRRRGGSEP